MVRDHVISFGEYNWRVLDNKEDRTLIISDDILELRWYHTAFVNITWADCDLRRYLNNEFYHKFSSDEKTRIVTVTNRNPDNQWFKTNGGADTIDHVFLLSLEEVCKYFGDSRARLLNKGSQRWEISDENNADRQAKFGGKDHWWRLRSPGYYERTGASVSKNGSVYVRGNGVYGRPRDGGGIRPAMWLKA